VCVFRAELVLVVSGTVFEPAGRKPHAEFATTEAELEVIYGPRDTPVATIRRSTTSRSHRMFIDASPFVAVATVGPEGPDYASWRPAVLSALSTVIR
jgi:hypothetical protein